MSCVSAHVNQGVAISTGGMVGSKGGHASVNRTASSATLQLVRTIKRYHHHHHSTATTGQRPLREPPDVGFDLCLTHLNLKQRSEYLAPIDAREAALLVC